MRDDSLAHSKLYFQLLRIIPLWIRETRYDLEKLRIDCNGSVFNPIQGLSHQPFLPTTEIVRQNWDEVLGRFQVLETELHRRIDAKTDEIRGLRDGVCRASLPFHPRAQLRIKLTLHPAALQRQQSTGSTQGNIDESVHLHLHDRHNLLSTPSLRHGASNGPWHMALIALLLTRTLLGCLQHGPPS
jgi:hypothetical protein